MRKQGCRPDDISLIAEEHTNGDDLPATVFGAGKTAAVGGGVELLAGLGLLTIPGLGQVVAVGWLASTALGAIAGSATGGVIGALVDSGTPEADAHIYSEAVRRGGVLVSVRTDNETDEIEAILNCHCPIDPTSRREEYAKDGWNQFDTVAPDYRPVDARNERV